MLNFILLVIYDGSKENHISVLENVKQLCCQWFVTKVSTTRIKLLHKKLSVLIFLPFPPSFHGPNA